MELGAIFSYTLFSYKNLIYKNAEAEICQKLKRMYGLNYENPQAQPYFMCSH